MDVERLHRIAKKLGNIPYDVLMLAHDPLVLKAYVNFYNCQLHHSNWGDDLNYYLIEELSGKNIVFKNNSIIYGFCKKNYLCIGSAIEWMCDEHTVVWGSGAMFGTERLMHHPKEVLAVRGALTRSLLLANGVDCPEIYGDPALLLPRVYNPQRIGKKYRIGVIPHIQDLSNPILLRYIQENDDAVLINLKNYGVWTDVIDMILQCEFVISSSLHGLIISDAYGIPNVWVSFSDKVSGGSFKYLDYFSSVHKQCKSSLPIYDYETICKISIHDCIDAEKMVDLDLLLSVCPFVNKEKYISYL